MNNNQRTRFLFDQMPVRGLHVQVEEVWQHILRRKHYPAAIRRALGELLAAGSLLSGNLKTEGTLIIQVQGQGALKMLVVEATRWDETAHIADDAPLSALLGNQGIFAITLQPKDGEPWQGIVPLEGGSIADMLMHYMAHSEQLETHIALAADEKTAAGFLLQRLPEEQPDPEAWQHVTTLAQTLTANELLHPVAQNMLLMLGGQEVGQAVAEEGSITVDCDFCNEQYTFDETDVNALFGSDIVSAVKNEHSRHTVQ